MHQEEKAILNVYVLCNGASKLLQKKLTQMQLDI